MLQIDPRPLGLCITHERDQRVPKFVSGDNYPSNKGATMTDKTKRVLALYDKGNTAAEIAKLIGEARPRVNNVIYHHRSRHKETEIGRDISPTTVKILEMYKQGMTPAEIAPLVGRERIIVNNTVYRYKKKGLL